MKKVILVVAGLLASAQVFATPSLTCPSTTLNTGSGAPGGWEMMGSTGTPMTLKLAGAFVYAGGPNHGECVYTLSGRMPQNSSVPSANDPGVMLVSDRTDLRKGNGTWTVAPNNPSNFVCASNALYGCTFGLLP